MATEHILRLRKVAPEELLSEDEVLKKDGDNPFPGVGDHPEPYRTYFITCARLEAVFQKEKVHSPLIAETPKGKGLIWRFWSSEVGVVLMKQTRDGMVLEENVTFLRNEDAKKIHFVLDEIVLNPPKWH